MTKQSTGRKSGVAARTLVGVDRGTAAVTKLAGAFGPAFGAYAWRRFCTHDFVRHLFLGANPEHAI